MTTIINCLKGSVLLVLVLFVGCAGQGESPFAEAEVQANIRATLDGMGEAVQNQDVDSFMAHWVNTDSLVYTRQGRTFVGWNEVYADAANSFPNLGNLTRNQAEVFISVLGPDAGVATTFTFLSSVGDDGSTQTAWFTFTATIAKQSDQRWKVVQAHSSYPASGLNPRGIPEE